ncbi:MAG: leucyl aminopeptidase (aminopeptidase T) [Candidatus Azotimanducaceae bacterium]|jgi:leucyl aminopeptidase (aminopeptidase T)
MRSLRWGEFGDTAVRKMADVQPGETLLILADTWTDMDIAEACLYAGLNAGANTQLLVIPRMSSTDTTEFNDSITGAMVGADVIIGLCPTMFMEKEACRIARESGTRVTATDVLGMEDFAIEGIRDVDYDRMDEIAVQIGDIWKETKHCRVTSELGTDIEFSLLNRPIDIGNGKVSKPGESNFFPGVSVANAPIERTINGTLVVDGNIPPGRLVRAPVTVTLENGVITDIKGGADAAALRAHFEQTGDPIATHLCHFTLGLNPRAKTSGSIHQDEHVLGAITFGFGDQDPGFGGEVPPCGVHCDLVLTTGTIECDGQVICKDNVLSAELGLGGLL